MLDALVPNRTVVEEDEEGISIEEMECVFLQAVYGSLGATLVLESKLEFDAFIKKTAGFMSVDDTDKIATYSKCFM